MTQSRLLKTAGVLTAFAAIILAGMANSSMRVGARVEDTSDQRGIQDSTRFRNRSGPSEPAGQESGLGRIG